MSIPARLALWYRGGQLRHWMTDMVSHSARSAGGLPSVGRLIVHAPNVHTGGGAILLNALLAQRGAVGQVAVICDRRMSIAPQIAESIVVRRVEPSVPARMAAEKMLRALAGKEDVVLAFGNLPPLFRLKARTVLFLQNRYLIDPEMSLSGFGRGARLRLALERLWLRYRIGNVDKVIVQTSSMATLFLNAFGRRAEVVPFNNEGEGTAAGADPAAPRLYDFIYVSTGEPHKNHRILIEAWALLAEGGASPSLALTLSETNSPDLVRLIRQSNAERGTNIINLGKIASEDVTAAYRGAGALIFPSLGESFGLPLIEATELGLPILASELDYVRDVVRPAETFDPRSPRSIARAVRRFMGLRDDLDAPVSAGAFLAQVRKEAP